MTTRELLEEIAYENDLEVIETTNSLTGYPSALKPAIIGFETYEQAERIANKYKLSIEIFQKDDGWQLYYRTNNKAYQEFENGASDYGNMFSEFTTKDIENFYEEEVKPFISDFDDFESLDSFIKEKKEILEKLHEIDDTAKVITCDGSYYTTIPKKSMSISIDVTTYVIGLIEY